jgi:hypothetical protein
VRSYGLSTGCFVNAACSGDRQRRIEPQLVRFVASSAVVIDHALPSPGFPAAETVSDGAVDVRALNPISKSRPHWPPKSRTFGILWTRRTLRTG